MSSYEKRAADWENDRALAGSKKQRQRQNLFHLSLSVVGLPVFATERAARLNMVGGGREDVGRREVRRFGERV